MKVRIHALIAFFAAVRSQLSETATTSEIQPASDTISIIRSLPAQPMVTSFPGGARNTNLPPPVPQSSDVKSACAIWTCLIFLMFI